MSTQVPMEPRNVLLHGHIFKNAGTTLDWSLERCFGPGFYEHREDKLMREDPEAVIGSLLNSDSELRVLSSHSMPCDPPAFDAHRFFTLLMLRHPLKRVRSVYDFEKRQDAETPGAKAAKKMNYEEYVAWRMQPTVGPTIRNFQTRYLCGRAARKADLRLGSQHLMMALESLRRLACVGIVERYDESMVLFEQTLKATFPELDLAYLPQNVSASKKSGKRRQWFEKLGASHSAVIEGNSLDLTLYELAAQQLDERIAEVQDFSAHLDAFRARCQALA